ncbi:MAG: hypothetical protein MZW92_39135 [Comamonadaceae bacterium]|nr:hypothetical protein [Comamonadaceae bacterium]
MTEGRVTVVLSTDSDNERFEAAAPSSPGIFRPVVKPQSAGKRQLVLQLESGNDIVMHMLGEVEVYADAASGGAQRPTTTTKAATIAFLKEQQWKIAFATARGGQAADTRGPFQPRAWYGRRPAARRSLLPLRRGACRRAELSADRPGRQEGRTARLPGAAPGGRDGYRDPRSGAATQPACPGSSQARTRTPRRPLRCRSDPRAACHRSAQPGAACQGGTGVRTEAPRALPGRRRRACPACAGVGNDRRRRKPRRALPWRPASPCSTLPT